MRAARHLSVGLYLVQRSADVNTIPEAYTSDRFWHTLPKLWAIIYPQAVEKGESGKKTQKENRTFHLGKVEKLLISTFVVIYSSGQELSYTWKEHVYHDRLQFQ